MIRTAFKPATVLTGLMLVSSSVLHADSFGPTSATKHASSGPSVTTYATGLTNPRGLAFGPDGHLYVAEAGTGGNQLATCDPVDNMFTQDMPYMAGFTGRVSRLLPDGTRETVASGLPSALDGFGDALGPTDLAWIGGTLYVLLQGGGCSRGLPDDPAGVARINPDGSYTIVADISAFVRAYPVAVEPECGPNGDCEPDGVPHSMLAHGNRLYVVETNHSSVLHVDPVSGVVRRIYDLSELDPVPIALLRHGNTYLLGGFGGLILSFDHKFGPVDSFDENYNPIVDMVRVGNDLFVLETFSGDVPFAPATGRVVRRAADGARTMIAGGLDYAIGLASRGRSLFVTVKSYGQGPVEGLGEVVRIEVP